MDYQLIEKARHISCFHWDKIDSLIAQAKDQDTISELQHIQAHKCLQEERMV